MKKSEIKLEKSDKAFTQFTDMKKVCRSPSLPALIVLPLLTSALPQVREKEDKEAKVPFVVSVVRSWLISDTILHAQEREEAEAIEGEKRRKEALAK